MAEELHLIDSDDKESRYSSLLPQIEGLVMGEDDLIANLSNVASALKYGMGFFWVGFYLVKDDQLVLGPFQGPIACTRIQRGKGVCGVAWDQNKVMIVEDVDQFPGHIACSSDSKSEIVIPITKQGQVVGVLDVDSNRISDFDEVDNKWLSQLCQHISDRWPLKN